MFEVAYATVVPPMPGKEDWKKVEIGFKLLPPKCNRAAGRPRKRRMVGVEEGGSTSKGKRRCKRCGGLGHLQKTCNENVLDPDAPPKKKKRTYKPKVVEIIETRDDPSKKRKLCSKKKKTTPAEPTPPDQTMQ